MKQTIMVLQSDGDGKRRRVCECRIADARVGERRAEGCGGCGV
jgi:hypothetical protein